MVVTLLCDRSVTFYIEHYNTRPIHHLIASYVQRRVCMRRWMPATPKGVPSEYDETLFMSNALCRAEKKHILLLRARPILLFWADTNIF